MKTMLGRSVGVSALVAASWASVSVISVSSAGSPRTAQPTSSRVARRHARAPGNASFTTNRSTTSSRGALCSQALASVSSIPYHSQPSHTAVSSTFATLLEARRRECSNTGRVRSGGAVKKWLGTPEPVHQDHDLPSVRRHEAFLRRRTEPLFPHPLQKRRGVFATGVGEHHLATGDEEGGYQGRERRDVSPLVEHVGGEDEIEAAQTLCSGRVPVEEPRFGLGTEVGASVVADKVEGGRVVVGGGYSGSAGESSHAREPDAATELDRTLSHEALLRDVARERHGARPELGPVGELLVPGEVLLVDKGVRGRRARNAIGLLPHLDGGLDQAGAAMQVREESYREVSRFFAGRFVYRVREAVAVSVRAPSS